MIQSRWLCSVLTRRHRGAEYPQFYTLGMWDVTPTGGVKVDVEDVSGSCALCASISSFQLVYFFTYPWPLVRTLSLPVTDWHTPLIQWPLIR